MSDNPRKSGTCPCCSTEVYEIEVRYPDDHLLAGDPLRMGQVLDHAERVIFLLADGKQMQVTLCTDCADGADVLDNFLQEIARINNAALEWESNNLNRVVFGAKPLNETQLVQNARMRFSIYNAPPVGILTRETWKAYNARMEMKQNAA